MKKAKLTIEGMHCASCSKITEMTLSKIPGVKKTSVNPITGKGFVEFEGDVTKEQLKDAVKEAGYNPVSVEFADTSSSLNEDHEIKIWKRKLLGVWLLTIPLMLIMYSERLIGQSIIPMDSMTYVMLILSFPVIFIFGFNTIKMGIRGFYKLYFTMDSLIALGTIVAFSTGIISLFSSITDFSGVSGMIMTIFITGKYIESRAKGRATKEIKKLLELGAKKARVLRGNQEIEIPIEEVKLNDILIVNRQMGLLLKGKVL